MASLPSILNEPGLAATTLPKRRVSVSVVVPCYRCRDTIERAVASIIAQSQWPLEVLLVDDCSGDGTLDLLHELKRRHDSDWIQVIALPINAGPASARNAGWNIARGDYIAFLDADDSWHRQKLQLQCQYMLKHPEIVLCGHRAVRSEPDMDHDVADLSSRQISPRQILFRNPFVTPSVMLKRDLPQRFRAGRRYMEDHLLWMEIALAGKSLVRLNARLACLHKAPFGGSGLSAQLWAMERADLGNYLLLHRSGRLGMLWLPALWGMSLIKFARRLLIASFPSLLARQQPR